MKRDHLILFFYVQRLLEVIWRCERHYTLQYSYCSERRHTLIRLLIRGDRYARIQVFCVRFLQVMRLQGIGGILVLMLRMTCVLRPDYFDDAQRQVLLMLAESPRDFNCSWLFNETYAACGLEYGYGDHGRSMFRRLCLCGWYIWCFRFFGLSTGSIWG